MSYINTIAHTHIGTLAGYSLYHPQESVIADRSAVKFGCSPANLVLSDDSGRHPGLVLHHLDLMVARYLMHRIECQDRLHYSPSQDVLGSMLDHLLTNVAEANIRMEDHFEFCGWSVERYVVLWMRATASSNASPHSPAVYGTIENWLCCNVGEFIWHNRPELMSAPFRAAFEAAFPFARDTFGAPAYGNIILATPQGTPETTSNSRVLELAA